MNYRHAFHAGNFADVAKHALLTRILVYLTRKAAPLRFIDTHAGLGRYDLAGSEASRTGEWRSGIARLLTRDRTPAVEALLQPYLTAVGAVSEAGCPDSYPGSPALAQALLRADDKLLLAELHPEDAITLRHRLGRDKRVTIFERDGYAMLNAVLPPAERRGLVLIDPPFEQPDEFDRLAEALAGACRKWATGVYAVWYPIKAGGPPTAFLDALRRAPLPPACRLELFRQAPPRPGALAGSGLFVVNPPYVLADEARLLLPGLAAAFDTAEHPPFAWRVEEDAARG